jgi:hypothetical protein
MLVNMSDLLAGFEVNPASNEGGGGVGQDQAQHLNCLA